MTVSRSDYGLLRWLMSEIKADPELTLQLVVTGSHLSPAFGETWREIDEDGFHIDARVAIGPDDDSSIAAARASAAATDGVARAFEILAPDLVVLLGDRYEVLAAASAALIMGLPIAHIHGGEVTEGAIDESIRHAVTKLASLHFVAAAPYADRVIQMGENPETVFDVGALGVEAARRQDKAEATELEATLDMTLAAPLFVVTYHPVTRGHGGDRGVAALLGALGRFDAAQIVLTGVNVDPGRSVIDAAMRQFAEEAPDRRQHVESLGARRYLSLIERADVVIGNSSSGIIEAPALGTPTVDIGDRQKGRLHASSIIHCPEDADAIHAAIAHALDPAFIKATSDAAAPYDGGATASHICETLKRVDLAALRTKTFHDIALGPRASRMV